MKNIDKGAPRGATPQLTVAKHQLRDWIESRLPELGERDDPSGFGSALNSDLRGAGLIFGPTNDTGPDPWSTERIGYLNAVRVQRRSRFVVIITSLDIQCGEDDSAYVYAWAGENWQRALQNEQDDYTEQNYEPQFLSDVLISPISLSNNYVALTLGIQTWCASSWHDVYFRAYRLGGDPLARPLISGDRPAFVAVDSPIRGSITPDDVVIQYDGRSIDSGILVRTHVEHYRFNQPQAERVDPLALRPRDFVDEWLTNEWRAAAFWSEDENRPEMSAWHKKLHKDLVFGEFTFPTMHCPSQPDLWQVGVDFSDPPKGVYFMVRWRPPYEFSMLRINDAASPACSQEDREADERMQTLFR